MGARSIVPFAPGVDVREFVGQHFHTILRPSARFQGVPVTIGHRLLCRAPHIMTLTFKVITVKPEVANICSCTYMYVHVIWYIFSVETYKTMLNHTSAMILILMPFVSLIDLIVQRIVTVCTYQKCMKRHLNNFPTIYTIICRKKTECMCKIYTFHLYSRKYSLIMPTKNRFSSALSTTTRWLDMRLHFAYFDEKEKSRKKLATVLTYTGRDRKR